MSRLALVALAVAGALAAAITGPLRPPSQPVRAASQPPPPAGAKNGEAWAWTQLVNGASHTTEIRFATTEQPSGQCPTAQYREAGQIRTAPMRKVSDPYVTAGGLQQFPTTLCTLQVPDGATGALIEPSTTSAATVHPGNLQLPLPDWPVAGRPRRIAVIGDAGCEVASPVAGSAANQDCLKGWPLHTLATHAAAQSRPDLVVHVGDYVYREQPQAADDASAGCDAQGQAADWGCLVKDFLRPAEPLLGEAPFVFARGNHEVCTPGKVGRGAEWFRYLATTPQKDNECYTLPQPQVEPEQINAGTLHFVLFDSSSADDGTQPDKTQAGLYAKWFDEVNDLAANHPTHDYFLITHKPLWTVKQASSTAVTWTNPTLASGLAHSAKKALAPNVRLVLSGHLHLYQMLDFAKSTRPPQLTVGSSGTTLDTAPDDTKVMGKTVDGETVKNSISHDVHGYAMLVDKAGRWHLTFRDSSGTAWPPDCALGNGTIEGFTCK
ncbi:MAG TPA: metallophosphoesterase [Spirillospora sp.]|nr:metallophosphoesterase [Spirillospora sp.]